MCKLFQYHNLFGQLNRFSKIKLLLHIFSKRTKNSDSPCISCTIVKAYKIAVKFVIFVQMFYFKIVY